MNDRRSAPDATGDKQIAQASAAFEHGVGLENGGDRQGAKSAYRQVIALDPGHVEALASLAWLDGQAGDTEAAREWAVRALAVDASNILARMALAFADLQDKRLDAAARGLASLYADPALTPVNRSIVLGLIGDLNDAQGDAARAFTAYAAANAELKARYPMFETPDRESALGSARRLRQWFETADPVPWRHSPSAAARTDDPRVHVFLVGFPRSGTTLLETVLAGHPDVVTLEEKESLGAAANAYLSSNEGLERLANLGSAEAEHQRESYWAAVRGFGVEPRGGVFVDKMPLATVLLPVISKLFPNARVLFAVRDPRDVVLSCFRRRFGMNAAMYELLTLEGAADYYDAVMRLGEIYRELLPIRQHIVRYESLVDDFETTIRSICGFLDLEWSHRMSDVAATARSRGITTPSAAQLARGLNREGQGAWHRYREQMAPVLPVLDPWIRRFGYR